MIVGEKVTLRAPQESDEAALYAIASDLDAWEERTDRIPTLVTRAYFAKRLRDELAEADTTEYVIEAGATLVGRCGLYGHSALTHSAEIGIAIAKEARGKGYGTDAMRLLVRFAFERRNLRRVNLSCLASNAAALTVYRRVGFVEEGRLRESAWVRGRYEDEIVMGLLRSEWLTASR